MKRILMLLVIFSSLGITLWGQVGNGFWEDAKNPDGLDGTGNRLIKATNGILYLEIYNYLVYRSNDAGNSWEPMEAVNNSFPNPVPFLKVGEAGNIFAHEDNGFGGLTKWFKTSDEGQTWIPLDSTWYDMLELPSGTLIGTTQGNSGLSTLRSIDGGLSWELVLTGSNMLLQYFQGGRLVAIKSEFPNFITYFRSTDDGLTWTSQIVPNQALGNLFLAPSGTIFTSSNNTLYRTEIGASNASTIILPQNNNDPTLTALPSGRLLMQASFYTSYQGESVLFFSDNDGVSWDTLTPPVDGTGVWLFPIALDDSTIFRLNVGALFRSFDGGLTWQLSSTGLPFNPFDDIKFVTDSFYYVQTTLGIWKTLDAGESWELLTQNNKSEGVGSRNFEITTQGNIIAISDDKLILSTDFGNTFTDITPPGASIRNDWYARAFIDPFTQHIFLSTHAGLKRSLDLGQTWALVLANTWIWDLGFLPSGRIIATSSSNVFLSDTGGSSWQNVQGFPESFEPVPITVTETGEIFIIRLNANIWSFFRSLDAGLTWQELPFHKQFWGVRNNRIISANNGFLYFQGGPNENHIFLSTNKGNSWQTIPKPWSNAAILKLAISPDQYLHCYASASFRSVNPVSSGSFIKGHVTVDADADCSTQDAQLPLKNRIIEASGTDFSYFTETDSSGRYVIFADTGAYNIKAKIPNIYWWDYCAAEQSLSIPEYYTTDTVDFDALVLSECPLITVNVAIPTLRRCFNNQVSVQYCNQGSITADSAYIDIFLDPFLNLISSNQPHNDLGNNQIRFFIGNLPSGDCGQFSFTTYVNCDSTILGQTHCITAHGYPDTLCIPLPSWSGANINARVNCQDSIVQFQLHNTGVGSSQVLDYIIIEDDVVMFQGQQQYAPDQSISIPVTANGHTYRIESEQEPGHPFSTRAIAFEEGCGGFESLGFINQFSVNGITPSWHRVCRENTGSFDPNDKHGYPLGFGADNRIRPGQALEYMIRFQNTGTDTAFTVVIRDSLSAWLDPASVVPGAASHPYTWQLQGSGEISFTFSNILLPDSTTNLAGSQGFVTFSVAQQPNVPLETQILNTAAIFFDFNAPVITNETRHTVGLNLISSTLELPKSKGQNAVQVSPNPASTHATFQLAKGDFKGHQLQLFSPMGKLVFETAVSGNQMVVPRNKLPAGAYGWRVADARGMLVGSGVLVFR